MPSVVEHLIGLGETETVRERERERDVVGSLTSVSLCFSLRRPIDGVVGDPRAETYRWSAGRSESDCGERECQRCAAPPGKVKSIRLRGSPWQQDCNGEEMREEGGRGEE